MGNRGSYIANGWGLGADIEIWSPVRGGPWVVKDRRAQPIGLVIRGIPLRFVVEHTYKASEVEHVTCAGDAE